MHGGEEAVLLAGGFGRVESAHDSDRAVGDDAAFDFARRLLGTDQNHPEAATPFGDVEQNLLDGALPLARGILVELVEHEKKHLGGLTGGFLLIKGSLDGDPDHETFGAVVKLVNVDHRHLPLGLDPIPLRVGLVTADQVLDMLLRALEPADEGIGRSFANGRSGPDRSVVFVLDLVRYQIDELAERADFCSFEPDAPVANGGGPAQLCHDVLDHDRILSPLVLGLGKEKRQEIVSTEFGQGPEEGGNAGRAGGDIGGSDIAMAPRWCIDLKRAKGFRGKVEGLISLSLLVLEGDVGMIEEKQVLALHVEDQGLGVDRSIPQYARVEQRVEKEGGVGGLGGDAADARDVDVSPTPAVYELEVDEERIARARKTDGKSLLHPVEEESAIAVCAGCDVHLLAGLRRYKDLGLKAGGRDLGGFEDFSRQQTLLDQEDVGVEASSLVAGPDLGHDPVDADDLPVGKRPLQGDHIVQLQESKRIHPYPELERSGVLSPDHPAYRGRHSPISIHPIEAIKGVRQNRGPPLFGGLARRAARRWRYSLWHTFAAMASDDDLLSLLTIAQVPVSINAAAFALDASPSEIRDISGRLEANGAIVETGRGYALAPGKTVEVKPALAAFLAERLAQNLDAGPAVRGRLLLEAGKAEEAWSFLSQEALDSGHRRHDSDRTEIIALALQARDAAQIEGGEAEGRLRLQLAMLYRWTGRSEDSQREIEGAIRLLSGEELVNALGFAAAVADDRQHPQAAERWVAMAESAAATLGMPAKLGSLLTFHGRELGRLGFAAEADAALHRGEALLDQHGSMIQRYYGRLNRAWLEFDQGDVGKAEMDFAFLVDQAGSLEGEASLASNLACWSRALYATGQPERAREVGAQASDLAARSGSEAASMLVSMGEAEGGLLFDRPDEALASADAALQTAIEHLPAWENATRYLKARALVLGGRLEEARTEVEAALAATPAGGDGLRWRSRIEALQLDLADTWNPERAADLADLLLQSGWFGAAVELLTARARRGRDQDVAAEAAALALQLGNPVQAAKAIEAGSLWNDPLAKPVAARLRTLPAGWEPDLVSNPAVASAIATAEDPDDEVLLSRIEQAMAAAGLSGDLVLSPAQRRAAGLHRPRRTRRRSGWQLAWGAAAVALLAVGSAAVTINLLTPPTTTTTATSVEVSAPTTALAAITETETPPPESRLSGIYEFRGGTNRAGLSSGGFREVEGYYWREAPGGSIVTSAIAYGPYIYFGTNEDIVYGLEMQTSLVNLTVVTEATVVSELAVAQPSSAGEEQSTAILTFSTSDGLAYGYDALRNGAAIWQSPIGRSVGAPLTVEDRVVYATSEGRLHALELRTGREIWTFDSGGESFVSGPAESNGILYVAARDGLLYLIDSETGESVCENPVRLTGTARTSPIVTGEAVFVGLESPSGVHVFGAGSCGVPSEGYAPFYPSSTSVRFGPAMTEETMYLIEERNLIALSLDPTLFIDPTVLPSPWERPFSADNLITTSPVLADGLVYIGDQDGVVFAVDATNGQEAWRFPTGRAIRGDIVVVPGAVFVTTSQGEIVAIAGE